jgi:hypothetical protein
VPVDDQHVDPVPGEDDRRGQTGRAGPDDQDVVLGHCSYIRWAVMSQAAEPYCTPSGPR